MWITRVIWEEIKLKKKTRLYFQYMQLNEKKMSIRIN